jgi:hypothetical protein
MQSIHYIAKRPENDGSQINGVTWVALKMMTGNRGNCPKNHQRRRPGNNVTSNENEIAASLIAPVFDRSVPDRPIAAHERPSSPPAPPVPPTTIVRHAAPRPPVSPPSGDYRFNREAHSIIDPSAPSEDPHVHPASSDLRCINRSCSYGLSRIPGSVPPACCARRKALGNMYGFLVWYVHLFKDSCTGP